MYSATLVFIYALSSPQYNLVELKRMCLEDMFPDITGENAAEALIISDFYKAGDVKAAAIAFIRRWADNSTYICSAWVFRRGFK